MQPCKTPCGDVDCLNNCKHYKRLNMNTYEIKTKNLSYVFSQEDMELIYDALNDYPQWNDDEDDNPTSVIMNKLYNLLEA